MHNNNIIWSWRDAKFGAVVASIAAIVIVTGNVKIGLAILIGSLPAAVIGLLPTRKDRLRLVFVGVLFGGFLVFGSFLAQSVWIAIPTMFLLAMGSAVLASMRPFGIVALSLCLPIAGVGLNFIGIEKSGIVGLLMIGGSVVAYGWSLCFKEYKHSTRPEINLMSREQSINYGLRLSLAAATATAIGFALGVQHVGWVVGTTLFVMRPDIELQKLQSLWRVVSVIVGALTASYLLTLDLQPLSIAAFSAGALIAAFATHASRWNVTLAFITFISFWAMLYGEPTIAVIKYHFTEQVLTVLLGVGLAYLFGILIPKISSRFR
jgi:hypothetical protein